RWQDLDHPSHARPAESRQRPHTCFRPASGARRASPDRLSAGNLHDLSVLQRARDDAVLWPSVGPDVRGRRSQGGRALRAYRPVGRRQSSRRDDLEGHDTETRPCTGAAARSRAPHSGRADQWSRSRGPAPRDRHHSGGAREGTNDSAEQPHPSRRRTHVRRGRDDSAGTGGLCRSRCRVCRRRRVGYRGARVACRRRGRSCGLHIQRCYRTRRLSRDPVRRVGQEGPVAYAARRPLRHPHRAAASPRLARSAISRTHRQWEDNVMNVVFVAGNVVRGILSRHALYIWGAAVVLMLLRAAPAMFVEGDSATREARRAMAVLGAFETWAFLCTAAAIFLGAATIASDIASKALLVVLARPVPRWQVLVGKWVGVTAFALV